MLTVPESLVFLRGQMRFMKERGFDITVVCSPGPALAAFSETEGVQVHAVEMQRRITPLADAKAVLELTALLRRLKPDIVHSHTPKGGLLGMLAARASGDPLRLYHLRGLPFLTLTGTRRALLRATERASCALAERVLCVSPSLREVAIAEGFVEPDKIRVLLHGSGNGVDTRVRFNPARLDAETRDSVRRELGVSGDAVVAGFIGRLVTDKGIVELLEAWRAVSATRPHARLVVVGEHEERDALPEAAKEALAAATRDPDRSTLRLVGYRPDVDRLYAAFDLVVLPTYREGLPNVVLEAAAMKLPVVATRIPGCVDALRDGETGTLVPVRDAKALGDAMARYIDGAALRAAHGAAARAYVETAFDQTRLWEALHGVYEELLATRSPTWRARFGTGAGAGGDA